MASSSASLADSGFPRVGSTTVGLVKGKVGGGGGGVKVGGGGGKFGGGGGGANAGGLGVLVCLWSALLSSDFLNCSSSEAADELVWKVTEKS